MLVEVPQFFWLPLGAFYGTIYQVVLYDTQFVLLIITLILASSNRKRFCSQRLSGQQASRGHRSIFSSPPAIVLAFISIAYGVQHSHFVQLVILC